MIFTITKLWQTSLRRERWATGLPVFVMKFQGTPLCHQEQLAHSCVAGEKTYQASLLSRKYRSYVGYASPSAPPGSRRRGPGHLWCMELLCFGVGKQQHLCLYCLPKVGLPSLSPAMMAAPRRCVATKGLSHVSGTNVIFVQA